MDERIKAIEDMSLNAWPSHQIQIYDGWLLRFSYFYTHRTNCIEQIGESTIPIAEKINFCEDIYKHWGSPCIYKISPLLDPSFDSLLEKNGYHTEHRVHNLVMDLKDLSDRNAELPIGLTAHSSPVISSAWIDGLFHLKNTTNAMHRQIVPNMYAAIPKNTIALSVQDKVTSQIIGTGLGILDRDYIGIYAIHVHPAFRRRHLGKYIVRELLLAGKKTGAEHAYLQVVSDNQAAIALYTGIGFRTLYDDWFRVKPL